MIKETRESTERGRWGDEMISDTLSEAAAEMRGDLQKMPDSYPPGEPLTARIVALIAEMDAVQREIEAKAAAELEAVDRQYERGEP